MTENPASDYAIMTPADARALLPVACVPHDLRLELLRQMAEDRGPDAMLELLSQFIGMANAIVDNCRSMVEIVLVTEGDLHPHTAEKVNLPTVLGALQGIELAELGACAKMCHGCAFRRGSEANQSAVTTADAEWCLEPGNPVFLCHVDMTADRPDRVCAGYGRAVQNLRARQAEASL